MHMNNTTCQIAHVLKTVTDDNLSKTHELTASAASLAALNRLARCWFILARGATPSAHNSLPTQLHCEQKYITKRCIYCIITEKLQLYPLTNSHVKKLPRPNHRENAVDVLEHGLENLLVRFRSRLAITNRCKNASNSRIHWKKRRQSKGNREEGEETWFSGWKQGWMIPFMSR